MLEVKNLHKTYGGFTAVQGISFSLKPGDIFGFIGSNGAGKTTTIRMIATLLEPTSGTATLNGVDILENPMEIRRMIGYMPDFFGLYDDVKVWEYLDFFASIYGVQKRDKVIDEVLELTDLTIKKYSFVQSLSRGMQQRLCLARCLVHDPKLLLLDEPASGLDPRARAELKGLIAELGNMGKIVIVSSHILPELSDFCNCVGIIERGNLLAFGDVASVVRSIRPTKLIRIRTASDLAALETFSTTRPNVEKCERVGQDEMLVEFAGSDPEQADYLKAIIDAGHRVVTFCEDEADLEDVFLKLTTGDVN
ncbi:MAG: ABC transporter ATP-binding protein [Armatimonadetes bacterium]|nr:ATP-binding cassette domain-containing protein [Armatimonadota bacterium]MBS1701011.1 ABC transporter ATP-binding protein [Armatimonadota bacterium]MBS1727835.1 ABC transporter ATP-binding protein [Armatimonadota bacterium]